MVFNQYEVFNTLRNLLILHDMQIKKKIYHFVEFLRLEAVLEEDVAKKKKKLKKEYQKKEERQVEIAKLQKRWAREGDQVDKIWYEREQLMKE